MKVRDEEKVSMKRMWKEKGIQKTELKRERESEELQLVRGWIRGRRIVPVVIFRKSDVSSDLLHIS